MLKHLIKYATEWHWTYWTNFKIIFLTLWMTLWIKKIPHFFKLRTFFCHCTWIHLSDGTKFSFLLFYEVDPFLSHKKAPHSFFLPHHLLSIEITCFKSSLCSQNIREWQMLHGTIYLASQTMDVALKLTQFWFKMSFPKMWLICSLIINSVWRR